MKIENIKKRSELFLKKLAAVFNYGDKNKGPDLGAGGKPVNANVARRMSVRLSACGA